jgi:hypothetical protein
MQLVPVAVWGGGRAGYRLAVATVGDGCLGILTDKPTAGQPGMVATSGIVTACVKPSPVTILIGSALQVATLEVYLGAVTTGIPVALVQQVVPADPFGTAGPYRLEVKLLANASGY